MSKSANSNYKIHMQNTGRGIYIYGHFVSYILKHVPVNLEMIGNEMSSAKK